ncbi:MAG: 1-acyl-sn-glycerol-3-phosphate acyltransferase [Candidatus Nitricoxidivorans perseverans]|uniref:1-acyl-sn-glycerol-3-phosphate acyltransferase n=1 Tax=Candidatus Nitricoxidivorans perseverans TaxID=2975601 RepID=A0AA49FJ15_9PROT|nr:MAG: 1-acyl-sn-glycerol-3-phosphate acyltransferase [Candidatus Nitricoxidivorans perseverans]
MIFLRSLLFMLAMLATTPAIVLALLSVFWLPARRRRFFVMPWVRLVMWLIRRLLRIEHRVLGCENIPRTPCVILSKHQSAWETFALQTIFPLTAFVYKKELHWLPFFGWGLKLMPFVGIDRAAGKDALAQVANQGRRRLGEGYSVIVFPEGTRVMPGHKKRYKIGGAWLAAKSGAPVVPVALNSGEFWRRNAFLKRPGRVTVSIGPAIDPAGLAADEINRRAEGWIEAEMRRISPHLYRNEATRSPTGAAA